MTGRRRNLDSNSHRQRIPTDDHRVVRELRSGHQQIRLDTLEEQDTASSAVAELDSIIDNLDSSITSIEEDSKEFLDEFREFAETHFRAVSEIEGAANDLEVKEESMSSASSDEEGGFSVEDLETRRSSRPEPGTVRNLLTALEQQPRSYIAALKTTAVTASTEATTAHTGIQQPIMSGPNQDESSANLAASSQNGTSDGSGGGTFYFSFNDEEELERRALAYAPDIEMDDVLKRFGEILVNQYKLMIDKYKLICKQLEKEPMEEIVLRMQLARVEQVLDKIKSYTMQLSECAARLKGGKALEHHFQTMDEVSEAFCVLKVTITSELENMKDEGIKPKKNSTQADFQKLLKVARAKPVDLPTYDGKSKAAYAGFKDSFKYIIERTSVPKELWGGQLEDSLKGDALDYVGGRGLWHGKYEELWAILDDKYANRWNVTTEAVSNFYFKPLPEGSREAHIKWFYEMANDLRALVKLNLSVEQLGTSMILQMMRADYANEVRSSLKVNAGKAGANKAAFSLNEMVSAVNDTLAVNHDPGQFCTARSTLTLQTAAIPSASSPAAGVTSSTGDGTRGRGSSRRGRGGFRGRGRGRGIGPVNCYVCPGTQGTGHMVKKCPYFKTVEARKQELIRQKRCPKCTAWEHQGTECLQLPVCPVAGCGELHRSYLCSKGGPARAGNL